jgi:hypothetical protein
MNMIFNSVRGRRVLGQDVVDHEAECNQKRHAGGLGLGSERQASDRLGKEFPWPLLFFE